MKKEKALAVIAIESEATRRRRPHPNRYMQHLSTMPRILDKIELPDELKRNTTSYHQPVKKKHRRIAGARNLQNSYWTSTPTYDISFSYEITQATNNSQTHFKH